ncbi:MAG: hypothetical protein ACK47B_00535 [Armatimonadota bacterium]
MKSVVKAMSGVRGMIGAYLIIILASAAAHGLLLINDGNYHDGLLLSLSLQAQDWSIVHEIFDTSGLPLYGWFHRVFGAASDFTLAYRLAAFILLATIGCLTAHLIRVWVGARALEAAVGGVLVVVHPAWVVSLALVNVPYLAFLAIYLTGVALMIRWERSGSTFGLTRLAALLCFGVSFHLESLLVVHLAVLLLMSFSGHETRPSKSEIIRYFTRRLDFVLLPFAWYFLSRQIWPRTGAYAEYNAIRVTPYALKRGVTMFLSYGLLELARDALREILKSPVASALIFFGAAGATRGLVTGSRARVRGLLAAALVLFMAGVLPYLIARKWPSSDMVHLRHMLVLTFPLALLGVVFLRLIARPANNRLEYLGLSTLALAAFGMSLVSVKYHQMWYFTYLERAALVQQLSRLPNATQYSMFWIDDQAVRMPPGVSSYVLGTASYEWGALFTSVWHDERRIGYDSAVAERYNARGLSQVFEDLPKFRNYRLRNLDLEGRQGIVKATPGESLPSQAALLDSATRMKLIWDYRAAAARGESERARFLRGLVDVQLHDYVFDKSSIDAKASVPRHGTMERVATPNDLATRAAGGD